MKKLDEYSLNDLELAEEYTPMLHKKNRVRSKKNKPLSRKEWLKRYNEDNSVKIGEITYEGNKRDESQE